MACPFDTIGNQWLTCMIPLAFDRRPWSEVVMAPVALTTKLSVITALWPGCTLRPSFTSRLAVFVQVVAAALPSTRTPDSDESSPKARGRTDRLIDEMATRVVFRIVI